MNELVTSSVQCPYCWEVIDVLVDCSVNEQAYVEDCQVCCRPINFSVSVDEYDGVSIKVSHEDEV